MLKSICGTNMVVIDVVVAQVVGVGAVRIE